LGPNARLGEELTTDLAVSTPRPRWNRGREALSFGISFFAAVVITVVVGLRFEELQTMVQASLGELSFWAALVLVMNLIPFNEGERSFSLDTPILLSVAILYPPAVACVVAVVGSLDLREVLGQVSFSRAIFNRTQIGLCVLFAGFVFNGITDESLAPWPLGTIGTAAALLTFHVINVVIVGAYTALRTRSNFRDAVKSLKIGSARSFLATYLGCGVLALVLANLFMEVGPWSVCLFLIPLIVARQMLVRGDALERLTGELRLRERLLERLFDRIVEERRDERLRIATGLHDDVLQSLVRISQLGSFLARALPEDESASQDARELEQVSQRTMEGLRNVLSDLKRSPVGSGGLIASLRTLAADLQLDWRTEIQVTAPDDLAIAPDAQIVAYQATREAIINALKHAAPSSVRVSCRTTKTSLTCCIEDDGVGFQPELVDEAQHFGLGLMRRRVELAGGNVEVRSRLKNGTTVTITLPEAGREQRTLSGTKA
jgi:two-component system sensor histidine kinase DegS